MLISHMTSKNCTRGQYYLNQICKSLVSVYWRYLHLYLFSLVLWGTHALTTMSLLTHTHIYTHTHCRHATRWGLHAMHTHVHVRAHARTRMHNVPCGHIHTPACLLTLWLEDIHTHTPAGLLTTRLEDLQVCVCIEPYYQDITPARWQVWQVAWQ